MSRACIICGQEYQRRSFWLDNGACSTCHPRGFFITWPPDGPKATLSIWQTVLAFHVVYAFLSSLILCSEAGVMTLYSLIVAIYSIVRMGLGAICGYPTLTTRQQVILLLMPVWGPVLVGLLAAGLLLAYHATGVLPYLERR